MSDYWKTVIPEVLGDLGIELTEEKEKDLIEAIEGCAETKSLYTGDECIPNLYRLETEKLKKELTKERSKVVCPECGGRGSITVSWLDRSSTSTCWKCNGEGKVLP